MQENQAFEFSARKYYNIDGNNSEIDDLEERKEENQVKENTVLKGNFALDALDATVNQVSEDKQTSTF